jgi:hypothetical protein
VADASSHFVAHPAPHRSRVSFVALFYGLFAAPIIWAGQFMATFGVTNHACYPGDVPMVGAPDIGFGFTWWYDLGVDLVALLLIASAGFVAFRNWQAVREETGGREVGHLMEVGEGRTRFLSIVGFFFSAVFFFVTATQTISLAMVPLCTY